MNKYKNISYFSLIILNIFSLAHAAIPTGIKINEINFNKDSKDISITVCNWDKKDLDMGNYQLWVSHGSKKINKTFPKDYILNYTCAKVLIDPLDLEIKKNGNIDIRIRLETLTGKIKDERNSSFFMELIQRFEVPDDPQVDIVIEELSFDKVKKTITAKICNNGENYRISHKYYMSTSFNYNNNSAKEIYKKKDLWAGSCWTHEMSLKQIKISKAGTYNIEVIADSGNAIEEKTHKKYDTTKEENNRKTIEITIKKIKKKVRRTKPTKKQSLSSMSLRERIAFIRNNKTKTTSRKKVRTKRSTRRRSLNYKSSSSRSTLQTKYPYLFR